jgi:hypothetical protein
MKKYFTNSTITDATKNEVESILLNTRQIMAWNPAISSVTQIDTNTFSVHRAQAALVNDEIISVIKEKGKIILYSRGGKLEYKLIFELSAKTQQTVITETLFIVDDEHLPLVLLRPIAKNAFNHNLQMLGKLCDKFVSQL